MAQRKTLTEAQIALLRWISDGCPEGVMEGDFYRISAAALHRRGLVNVSGRRAEWKAKITSAGRAYLEQVDGRSPPLPRQANVSVTQQLVDDVIAAGGTLRVPRKSWYDKDGVDYENRARLAEAYGKVPAGQRLVATEVSSDELELKLVDAPDRVTARAELLPVSVPEKISRYHAAARAFRDRKSDQEVSRALLPRAIRILHTIATEAERRGWSARASSETESGQLRIEAGQHTFGFRLHERGVHARGRWEDEVRRYSGSGSWYSDRERALPSGHYDANATGQLLLELHSDNEWAHQGRQHLFADRQSWTLEERLPHLFREIEERIVEADYAIEERRIAAVKAEEARQRAAEERERRWHVLMAEAEERLIEAHRAEKLRAEAEAWLLSQSLSRYCDAMEAAFGDRAETAEWLSWARGYILRLDPLHAPPAMPEPPKVTPDALQEFLPSGWSAYGHNYTFTPPRKQPVDWRAFPRWHP